MKRILTFYSRTNVQSQNEAVENRISVTVVFPDSKLPKPTNGGFQSQEEFRKYVAEHQDGRWTSTLHARPLPERLADYNGSTIAQAFPLLFPYGHSGFQEDPAVQTMASQKNKKKHMKRNQLSVIRKYLRHRKPAFHEPKFNLISENIIMKQTIFQSAQMYCNVSRSDKKTMGEMYGTMSAADLNKAIDAVRRNDSIQHSSRPENQYLKSIRAICSSLPHSNENSELNRKMYFSFLMAFGLPAIFLTVTPDDTRCFRILVYALYGVLEGKHQGLVNGEVDVNALSDEDIIADFKIRQEARVEYPGLCAEEYSRIIDLVIKHIFSWDSESQESTGIGLLGEVLAWCLATEEQGRKTLHGHLLLFIKNWMKFLSILQRRRRIEGNSDGISFEQATAEVKKFYKNACSAQLFSDFVQPSGSMCQQPVFFHEQCRSKRRPKEMRFTAMPVDDQCLREMRHKRKCHEHNGCIATCQKCGRSFTVQYVVETALQTHLGTENTKYYFPDHSRRLDRIVYEAGKDFDWPHLDSYSKSIRYFAANAISNVHAVSHASRCFKKGPECYANLPDRACSDASIFYSDEPDIWFDWMGNPEPRYMFRLYPERQIEDAFMNTHNPMLTSLLGCNTNVMVAMNGCSVFYVTNYNIKSQQKEERAVFQKVSEVLVSQLEKQVREISFLSFSWLRKFLHM